MFDLRQLKYFIAVAETESVIRASEKLHISQSPLSRQILQLEGELGLQLFERVKKRIYLTPEGKEFLVEARNLLLSAERLDSFAKTLSTGAPSRLAVGFVEGAMHANLVGPIIAAFKRRHGRVAVSMHCYDSARQCEMLAERTLDIGFTDREPPNRHQVASHLLLRERMALAVPANHPLNDRSDITPADLQNQSWITVARRPVDRTEPRLLAACARANFTPSFTHEASDPMACLHLVNSGLGCALVPTSLKSSAPPNVRFKDLPWFELQAEIFLTWTLADTRQVIKEFCSVANGHVASQQPPGADANGAPVPGIIVRGLETGSSA